MLRLCRVRRGAATETYFALIRRRLSVNLQQGRLDAVVNIPRAIFSLPRRRVIRDSTSSVYVAAERFPYRSPIDP
jgi:hypothetical protein